MTATASAQERLALAPDPVLHRDELLARGGVTIPVQRDAAPFRLAGRRRPRWLAFLLRVFS